MCPFPNEGLGYSQRVPPADFIEQVRWALSSHSEIDMVSIYNDGSFFSEVELPSTVREEILGLVADSGASLLMVESLPQLVTRRVLESVKDSLGSVRLAVGIGLQSSSEFVREVCVNSPVTEKAFLEAHKLLQEFGQLTKAYVMFKPPFLTENEAIEDTVASVEWLNKKQVQDISICPTRIVEGTVASKLASLGLFTPPRLTSVLQILERCEFFFTRPRVSVFNVESSDIAAIAPSGCDICSESCLAQIRTYNLNPMTLDGTYRRCDRCYDEARRGEPMWYLNLNLRERVTTLLEAERHPEKFLALRK